MRPISGQHELAVHSADDPASRQQKRLQQRQLALKRQRDLTKSSFGAGVTAQLDTPLDASPVKNKALGWGKMLQAGIDGGACSSSFMRIIVPHVEEESCPMVTVASLPRPSLSPLEAVVQDIRLEPKSETVNSGSGQPEIPATMPTQPVFQESAVDNCWGMQSESQNQEKHRGRKLWKPWGTSKRNNGVTETFVEEMRVRVLPAAEDKEREHSSALSIGRASTPWQPPSDVSARVCILAGAEDKEHEHSSAMSIGRAATPWQPPCDISGLEETDLCSIPGFTSLAYENGQEDGQEDSLEVADNISCRKDVDLIDKDNDDSGDSGIEETVSEWKSKENKVPNLKKSRFNRFIPTVQAPKFWRSSKAETNPVTKIETNPGPTCVTDTPATPEINPACSTVTSTPVMPIIDLE